MVDSEVDVLMDEVLYTQLKYFCYGVGLILLVVGLALEIYYWDRPVGGSKNRGG